MSPTHRLHRPHSSCWLNLSYYFTTLCCHLLAYHYLKSRMRPERSYTEISPPTINSTHSLIDRGGWSRTPGNVPTLRLRFICHQWSQHRGYSLRNHRTQTLLLGCRLLCHRHHVANSGYVADSRLRQILMGIHCQVLTYWFSNNPKVQLLRYPILKQSFDEVSR